MGCGSSTQAGEAYKEGTVAQPQDNHTNGTKPPAAASASSSSTPAPPVAPIPASAPSVAARQKRDQWLEQKNATSLEKDLLFFLGLPQDFATELAKPSASIVPSGKAKSGLHAAVDRFTNFGKKADKKDESAQSIFWIQGNTGTGAGSVPASLLIAFPREILAVHLVKHDSKSTRSAKKLIKSFAYQLAQKIPAYARALHKILPEFFGKAGPTTDKKSAAELWGALIIDPLSQAGGEIEADRNAAGKKFVLLVGGLDEFLSDEADVADLDDLEFLLSVKGLAALPSYLGVILTSAPNATLDDSLTTRAKVKPFDVVGDNLKIFISHHVPVVVST
jgi:hypothetical protein